MSDVQSHLRRRSRQRDDEHSLRRRRARQDGRRHPAARRDLEPARPQGRGDHGQHVREPARRRRPEEAVHAFERYDRVALRSWTACSRGHRHRRRHLDVQSRKPPRTSRRSVVSRPLEAPYLEMGFGACAWAPLCILFLGEPLTTTAMAFRGRAGAGDGAGAVHPLIISSAAPGSQAATLIIRALALDEVTLRDWWRIMRREILMGRRSQRARSHRLYNLHHRPVLACLRRSLHARRFDRGVDARRHVLWGRSG